MKMESELSNNNIFKASLKNKMEKKSENKEKKFHKFKKTENTFKKKESTFKKKDKSFKKFRKFKKFKNKDPRKVISDFKSKLSLYKF